MTKIAYIYGGRQKFPMVRMLRKEYDVDDYADYQSIKNPDDYEALVVEYLGYDARTASQHKHKNLIVITHGIEVYEPKFMDRCIWGNIKWFLALQQHQIDYFKKRFPQHKPQNLGVLPLTVDFDKFTKIRRPNTGKRSVALIANITGRKGVDQIPELLLKYPHLVVHHLGKPMKYGHPVEEFVRWRLERDGTADRYVYDRWVDHGALSRWLEDKNYIWIPSISEGFCRAGLEGMAKGLTPIVRHWAGAETIYPKANLYDTVDEIGKILEQPIVEEKWRKYAMDRYSDEVIIKQFKKFI